MADTDEVVAGSIPKSYKALMVPLILEAYALDMAELAAASSAGAVLETAAGSGVVWSRERLRSGSAAVRDTW